MTIEQIRALRAIAAAIIETVRDADKRNPAIGAPAGPMYAALMTQGCTLHQFDQIMAGLVNAGMLTKSGHCYHVGAKIPTFMQEAVR